MERVSLGETQGRRVALSKAFLNRVFVVRDGKGGGKDNKLQIRLENLQVKAVCLSEINQNPQRVCFRQESLKKNIRLLLLMELYRICASEIRSHSLQGSSQCPTWSEPGS